MAYLSKSAKIEQEQEIEAILASVGPAGEQARADEQRYFEVAGSRSGSRADQRELDLVVRSTAGDAAIITMAERSWYKGRPRGSRFEVYLVLRDETSRERHVLRIPPKFGRFTSATFQQYMQIGPDGLRGNADLLIRAATAWTFGLKANEYKPQAVA